MKIMNGLDLQSQKIVSLADPSANTDAANKQYVDNVARGLQWKSPVRAASTADVTVASPGATLDGVTLAVNDRLLLKNQTAAAENGIYVWTASGTPLTRAADADASGELAPGTAVSVAEGTVNADRVFLLISDAAITIGTTAQSWGQLGGGSSSASGDVVGPASSVDNYLPRFDGTTGKLLQGSLLAVDDSGNVGIGTAPTGPGTYNTVSVGGVSSAKHGQVLVRGNAGQLQAYLYGGTYAGIGISSPNGLVGVDFSSGDDENYLFYEGLALSFIGGSSSAPLETFRLTLDNKLLVGTALAGSALVQVAGTLASSGLQVGPQFTLVNQANCTVTADTITKTGGTEGYNAEVYSVQSYVGDVVATFAPDVLTRNILVGLDSNPSENLSAESVDYGMLYNYITGGLTRYEAGVQSPLIGTYTPGDVLGVRRSGTNIEYLQNGIVISTLAGVSAATPLHFDALIVAVGDSMTDITFGPTSAVLLKVAGKAEFAGGVSFGDGTSQVTANSPDVTLLARANHTGTQPASSISDFTEASQDVVGAMVAAAGAGSYDDGAGTISLPGVFKAGLRASYLHSAGPISVGDHTVANRSFDTVILAARSVNATDNSHIFSASCSYANLNGYAFAEYDARSIVGGTTGGNHIAGLQAATEWASSGTLTDYYGLFAGPVASAGIITTNHGVFFQPVISGSGSITQNVALDVPNLPEYTNPGAPTSANTNYVIRAVGSMARSRVDGQFSAGFFHAGAFEGTPVEAFTVETSATRNAHFYAGSSGYWNWRVGMDHEQTSLYIKGNNTVGYEITAVTNHLLPGADGTQNLGSASKQFNNLYLDGAITFGDASTQSTAFTGTLPSSAISDFNSATRAQTEAELIAGANITITPAGSGATRTLTIASSGGGGGVSDGDKGDITVSGGGAAWAIDAGAVTLAKMADVASGTVFYRKTAASGVPEVQTLATLKTDLGLTGTNSGDQASIVGISGTLAQFNTAVTDADLLSVAAAAAAYQPLAAVLTGTTASFTTAQESKLAGIAAGATANSADATLLARANHTGTQTSATISDFTEASQDVVGAMVAAAGGTYDDGAGTITLPGGGGGSPGGATGELQYNNAGAFAGAANVEVAGGNLKLVSTTDPAAPSGGLLLYSKLTGGRHLPKIIGPSGIDTVLQVGLHGNAVFMVAPASGTTAPTAWGGTLTTAATMSMQQTIASANPWQATARKRFASAGTAGSSSGMRTAYVQWFRGNAAGFGGFFFRAQIGQNLNVNGSQRFVGLCASTAALATTAGAVGALLNSIGMGYDTTDSSAGNWQIFRNDGAGTATKVDLGANAARNTTHGYDLIIYCPPGAATEIFVRVVNIDTGIVVLDTSYTTDLPAVNVGMAFKAECNNGAVASATNLEVAKVYIESDY